MAHGGGKAQARQADATGNLAEQLDGMEVLVNSASYRINLEAMEACLEAGCDYLDLGGLYHVTLEQLHLHRKFEAAGSLAVLGIGSSPGKTNLMAARAVRELGDEPVIEIEVCAAGRDPAVGAEAFSPPYALQTLIDELTLDPVVLRAGERAELSPLTHGGIVDYGDPIGEGDTIYTLHSELATFAESFGCLEASFRLSLSPVLFERLKMLTEATPAEIDIAAAEAVPASDQTVSVHLVAAHGPDSSVIVRAITRPYDGLGGSIVSTGAPAAATVRLLARDAIGATGVHPPERCIDADLMFAELETRGCSFSVARR